MFSEGSVFTFKQYHQPQHSFFKFFVEDLKSEDPGGGSPDQSGFKVQVNAMSKSNAKVSKVLSRKQFPIAEINPFDSASWAAGVLEPVDPVSFKILLPIC